MTMLSPEYAGGFFDGEGCVSIMFCSRRKWKSDPSKTMYGFKLSILISNTNTDVLELFKERFGGSVGIANRLQRKPNQKDVYAWRLTGTKDQLAFLETICHYSIVKKEQIAIGITYLRTGGGMGKRISQDDWDIRLDCHKKMVALNKRGNGFGHTTAIPINPQQGFKPKQFYTPDQLYKHMSMMRKSRHIKSSQ